MQAILEGITNNRIIIDLSNEEYEAFFRACTDKGIHPTDAIMEYIKKVIAEKN